MSELGGSSRGTQWARAPTVVDSSRLNVEQHVSAAEDRMVEHNRRPHTSPQVVNRHVAGYHRACARRGTTFAPLWLDGRRRIVGNNPNSQGIE